MQKLLTFFSAKILVYNYAIFNDQSFNDSLINDIISFEQLGPGLKLFNKFISLSIYMSNLLYEW